MTTGTIFDIKRYAIHDGPGIRTAVFLKGCPLKCWWCHNPEGQGKQVQLIYRANRCRSFKSCVDACPIGAVHWDGTSVTDWERCDACGKCAEACSAGAREMVGWEVTVESVMAEVERDIPFYDQSGGGVTFTGGEPMFQLDFLRELLAASHQRGIHTIVDTSGYASWESFEAIFPLVDLFLYDLKLMDDLRHRRYTSVSNQRILENLAGLSQKGARIIVRMPLIPGINDDEVNMQSSAAFLSHLPALEGVELMPYHEIGLAKYPALGMNYQLGGITPPSPHAIDGAYAILAGFNLPVRQQALENIP